MLKRLIKMVTKVKRDNRLKKARAKFENRYIKNQRIAQYEHKKMLEVSQQLRKNLISRLILREMNILLY